LSWQATDSFYSGIGQRAKGNPSAISSCETHRLSMTLIPCNCSVYCAYTYRFPILLLKALFPLGMGGMNFGWMVVWVFELRSSRKCSLKVFATWEELFSRRSPWLAVIGGRAGHVLSL